MTLDTPPRLPRAALPCLALVALAGCNPAGVLQEDRIIEADLFSPQPEMLSAGYGFEGIIGVAGGEPEVRADGGTWNHITCSNGDDPPRRLVLPEAMAADLPALGQQRYAAPIEAHGRRCYVS